MARGFTLIELLITLIILSILLVSAVPSFGAISQTVKMKRLASELNGFLIQAKSEAVARNEDLKVEFSFASSDPQSTGSWHLALVDATKNQVLYLDGSSFNGIQVTHNYASSSNDPLPITYEKIRGRPSPGSISFHPVGAVDTQLKAILSNPPGRVRICSVGAELYDYKKCTG